MSAKTKKTIVKVILDISIFSFLYDLVLLLQLKDNLTFTILIGVLLVKICEILNRFVEESEDKQ